MDTMDNNDNIKNPLNQVNSEFNNNNNIYNGKIIDELVIVVSDELKLSQAVARKTRELGVYSEVLIYGNGLNEADTLAKINQIADELKSKNPAGIIFINELSNKTDNLLLNEISKFNKPILQIKETDEEILKDFLFNKCKLSGGWNVKTFIEKSVLDIKNKVGDKKVLCGLSGGVDSSVTAVLVNRAVGKQLSCIFVDHGLLRKYEAEQVENIFKTQFDINLIKVNAQDRFLDKLSGIRDPEKKRKIIGEEFIRVFEEEAKRIGEIDFLAQGTIYPDVIESGIDKSSVVKSHHNVGGLPEKIGFKGLIEPLKYLFKDEVIMVGRELGIPESIILRQPFPGPGLAVRVIGEVNKEKLDILRDADFIFREEIEKAGLNKELSQYFAVLTDVRSVGVRNGIRTYDYTIALRAIKTNDFMTVDWVRLPYDVLAETVYRIVNEVDHINRVVYDITPKPPATVEWE